MVTNLTLFWYTTTAIDEHVMITFGIAKPKNNRYTAYDVLFGSSHAGAQLNINILLYRIYQKS